MRVLCSASPLFLGRNRPPVKRRMPNPKPELPLEAYPTTPFRGACRDPWMVSSEDWHESGKRKICPSKPLCGCAAARRSFSSTDGVGQRGRSGYNQDSASQWGRASLCALLAVQFDRPGLRTLLQGREGLGLRRKTPARSKVMAQVCDICGKGPQFATTSHTPTTLHAGAGA